MWKVASLTALLPALFGSTPLAATVKKSHISDCENSLPLTAQASATALTAVIHLPYAFTVPMERLPTNSTAFFRIWASSILSISRHDVRVLPSDVDWVFSSVSIGEVVVGTVCLP